MTPVGLTLQPEETYLDLLGGVILDEPDYYEVAPETLWRPRAGRGFGPNGFHARFKELRDRTRRPFVAHGVGLSFATASPDESDRADRLACIRADHRVFDFRWYTDHLGTSVAGGLELTLPLPVLMTPESARITRRALARLQRIVPDVGVENSVFYFHLGDPLDEPAFLDDVVREPRTHLLLDLHNVYTTALNAGFDPTEYVDRLPFSKVIEIHVSGGGESDPRWLESGRTLRLDSHDGAVPEEVWKLLERTVPKCTNLRGVTLERMEGTVEQDDVLLIRDELRRVRRIVEAVRV